MPYGTLTIYHCYFCGLDFGLSAEIQPNCPCCRNEDDVLMIAEVEYDSKIFRHNGVSVRV